MITAAATTLAARVSPERLAAGSIYPPIQEMRAAAREIAVAVAREAVRGGQARLDADDLEAEVDAAIWWPDYVPYTPIGAAAG